jgi:N-acetylglutamate synthase/N-acetylornithine aminotransferase
MKTWFQNFAFSKCNLCRYAWGCDLTYDYVKINAEYTT